MKKIKRSGFTLVEVLGALVIISILATLVIPKITEYMANAKQRYNEQLKGELLLAGKSYYADNKAELPTIKTPQKFNYVTVPTMTSNNYITKDFVDSNGNDCSSSYVHVRQKTLSSNKYIYTPCLICEDNAGKMINYTEENLYCTVANFADDAAPTCDMIDVDYDTGEEVVLKNIADKLGKGSNTPGRIKGILISSDLPPVLEEGTYLKENISFIVVDGEVQIDVEDQSNDEIMGMNLRSIIEEAYKPSERGGNYDIQIMDTSLNISKSCIVISLSDSDRHTTEKDSNTCNLIFDNNVIKIKKLVIDKEITDIYYIDPLTNAKVSIYSTLSSKIKQNLTEHSEGYPIGSYYIDKDTVINNIPMETELIYVNYTPRDLNNSYTPVKCNITKPGIDESIPKCEGSITDNKLTIKKAEDESGIKDIYYISGTTKKSILPEDKKGTSIIEELIEQNVPKDASVKIINMQDTVATCNIIDIPNTKTSNKSGYPHCTITRTDDNEYLNITHKTASFIITCDEKDRSTLTLANNPLSYIITNNLKGAISLGSITGNNSKTVKINVNYEAFSNVSGNDYLKVLPNFIKADSTGNSNESFNSELLMVDTIAPTIIYTVSSAESLIGGVTTYLTPFRVNVECLDTGSDVDYLKINNVKRSNPKVMTINSASDTPKNYDWNSSCKDIAGNNSDKNKTYRIMNTPKSNCKFDSVPSGYIKKGGSATIKASCTVPSGNDTLNIINKNNFSSTADKATLSVSASGAGTSKVTFNINYAVKDNKIGTDYVRMNAGVVETTNNIKNNQVTSNKINVDSRIPKVSIDKANGTYKANNNGAFQYTVSCTDEGSGVKSIVVDKKTYNVSSKTFSIKKAVTNQKHTAYCVDKAGNKSSTITRTYSVKVYGRNKSCGVQEFKTCASKNCKCKTYENCGKCGCANWVCPSGYTRNGTNCNIRVNYKSNQTYCNNKCPCKCISADSGTDKQWWCNCQVTATCTKNVTPCTKCNCKRHYRCKDKLCGVESYKQCWHL